MQGRVSHVSGCVVSCCQRPLRGSRYFPNASLTGCPQLWDINASLDASTSCTVLLDTTTGAIVPHWDELDHASDDDVTGEYPRAFMIWPSKMLTHGHR